jgi:hypothetical protein
MKEIKFFHWAISKGFNKPLTGIRAPCLGTNPDYFRAIQDSKYQYDSSQYHRKDGLYAIKTQIPLRKIEVRVADGDVMGVPKYVLPFDYDFSVIVAPRGKPEKFDHVEMEKIFFDSLCYDYLHSPHVTQVCLHFEKYEGDPYLNAMKRFVQWVADKQPEYFTYQEWAVRTAKENK